MTFGKDIIFGSNMSPFNILCHVKDDDGQDGYAEMHIAQHGICGLMLQSENKSALILNSGQKIHVDLSLDALKNALENYDANGVVDLRDVTGMVAETRKLKAIFDTAVKGKRSGNDFNIVLHGFTYSDNDPRMLNISSDEVRKLEPSSSFEGYSYFCRKGDDEYFYMKLPLDLVDQFYTHAAVTGAAMLDLTAFTYPNGAYRAEVEKLASLPPVYTKTLAPKG